MGLFQKKSWTDRITQYPNRRKLNIVENSTSSMVVEVERNEGKIAQEGEAFNAENMNNLENRINTAFEEGLGGCRIYPSGGNYYITDGTTPKKLGSSEGTATTAQVLAGATFNSKNTPDSADVSTGTMPNKGAWMSETSGSGKTYIPEGYHNGSGYVDTAGAYTAGQNASVYNLGSGTSINVKSKLPNVYSKLKTANFSLKLTGISVSANWNVSIDANAYSYGKSGNIASVSNATIPTLSYNATTGVLTVSNTTVTGSNSYNDKNSDGKGMSVSSGITTKYTYDIICNVGTMN